LSVDGVIEVSFEPTPPGGAPAERREATASQPRCRLFTLQRRSGRRRFHPGTLGHEVVYNLLAQRCRHGLGVNERAPCSAACPPFPSLLDIRPTSTGGDATPAERVVESIEVRSQTRGRSSSPPASEAAPRAVEAEVVATARRGGVRVLGPNCLGLVNTDPDVRLHATFAPTAPMEGDIGILAQSGTLAAAIIDRTRRVGLGLSSFVAAGNRADIGASDLLRYWYDEPRTKGVLLYLESFGRIERFVRSARALTAAKPVIAVAAGSALSASPSTGLGQAPDPEARLRQRIAKAVFRQTGIVRVGTLHQLLDVGRLLSAQGVPQGIGVTVVGNSGGAVDLAVGECASAGLTVLPGPRLSWRADAEDYRVALEEVLADDRSASVLIVHAPPELRPNPAVNDVILDAAVAHPERVITVCNFDAADVDELRRGSTVVPVYEFPEPAARALGRLAGSWAWTHTRQSLDDQDAMLDPVTDGVGPDELARTMLDQHGEGALPLGTEEPLLAAAGADRPAWWWKAPRMPRPPPKSWATR
jgi:acyl-CoA synthetase (NDP forming)